ncbi:MAG: phosphotransferase [Candidatus Daviesbacteria bacterium]|nr:MAG: phosphotransferase [Candidatus Daviesbacteria bacterium]
MYKLLEKFAIRHLGSNVLTISELKISSLSIKKHLLITTKDNNLYLVSQFSNKDKLSFANFINTQTFLDKHRIRVPSVLAKDKRKLLFIQKYLGDLSLYKFVSSRDISSHDIVKIYQKVINLLIDAQLIRDKSCIAFEKEFGLDRLIAEYNIFVKPYLIDNLWKNKLNKIQKVEFKQFYQKLAQILAEVPKVFCFRDFQSTNLILDKDSNVFVIDFQGARLAFPQYDLASLLEDNYIILSQKARNLLLDYYMKEYQKKSGTKINVEEFKKIYRLATIQRKLHDLAIFVRAKVKENNDYFMKYIPENMARLTVLLQNEGLDFNLNS